MIDTSPLNRHTKIALCVSGGKDSLALVYLLRPHLDRVTIYHMDTGDLLPEIKEAVAHVESFAPHFVRIQGHVQSWHHLYGRPTDLLPYTTHEVGKLAGQGGIPLVPRYTCCFANLMSPIWERLKADGITLVIRGTKRADLAKLPAQSGTIADGIEIWHPIEDWSHERVFAYLRSVQAPIPRLYDHMTNAPECARCTAWWGEKRASYLKQFYPELYTDYMAGLRAVTGEIIESVNNLNRELEAARG